MSDQEKTPPMAVMSIRVPVSLADEVYRTAQREKTTASDYIRASLMRSLSSKDVKSPPK